MPSDVNALIAGFSGLQGPPIVVTRSRAFTSSDNGRTLLVNSPGTVYLTDPGNLPDGFTASVVQIGAGVVQVIGTPGVSVASFPTGSHFARETNASGVAGNGISAVADVQSILATLGARVIIPGVGEMNFGQNYNAAYSDAAGLTLAALEGNALSIRGSNDSALLGSPALGSDWPTNPPLLKRNATTGADFIEFGSSNNGAYSLNTPFTLTDRFNPFFIMIVASATSSTGRTLYSRRTRNTGASDRISIDLDGTNLIRSRGNGWTMTGTTVLNSTPRVISSIQRAAADRVLRVNGVQEANSTFTQTTQTSLANNETIGAETTVDGTNVTGLSSHLRGAFYCLVTASSAPSDADALKLERFFGSLGGVVIP